MSPLFLHSIAIVFALLPALLWLGIWYSKDSQQPEPKEMILLAFVFGMLGIIPFFGIEWMLERSNNLQEIWSFVEKYSLFLATIILTVVLAGLEEFIKHFAVLRLGKKLHIHFDQIIDGIVYSVSAALGFSFMENVLYFTDALLFTGITPEFWSIYIFRSLGTMLGHALFSGVFGFFWGYAFFSQKIATKHTESTATLWRRLFQTLHFHIIIRHVLQGRPSRRKHERADLVREGFLLATCLHTIFNLLLVSEVFGKNLTFLTAPLIVVLFIWLSHQFFVKENIKIWEAV